MAAQEAVEPIFRAVDNGDTEGVARMLDEDPRLLSASLWGDTLLVRAAERPSIGMVRLLLEKGADINAANAYGRTALHLAATYANDELASILLWSGADPSSRSISGTTPLYLASFLGYEALVRVLLRHMRGRGVDERTTDGFTALWRACLKGHAEIVRALLLGGADHTIADNEGRTPLQKARQKMEWECVAIIEVRTTTRIVGIQPTVHGFALDSANQGVSHR
jgi:ankyrin repeat protein